MPKIKLVSLFKPEIKITNQIPKSNSKIYLNHNSRPCVLELLRDLMWKSKLFEDPDGGDDIVGDFGFDSRDWFEDFARLQGLFVGV